MEADAGEQLIFRTGGLDLWPSAPAYPMADYTGSMDACGVAYERLSAAEVMRRWPQFDLPDDVTGIYQADGGIATPTLSNAAHRRLALGYGATIRDNAPVEHVRPIGDELEVTAGGVVYRCRHLIIAAGAWSNHVLAHLGRRLHLTVTQEQVTYFHSPLVEEFFPDRFPVWIWMDEPSFYGFPVFGEAGPKAAQDVGGERVTPETRTFEPNAATLARTEAFLARVLPGVLGPHIPTKTCLYDLPPDRNFALCRLPEQPKVALAIVAGHASKVPRPTGGTRDAAPRGAPAHAGGRRGSFVARVGRGVPAPPVPPTPGLYGLPPARTFVLCRLPEQPNVALAIGAGHAYKFASLIGRILSELAIDGRTGYDIGPFHIDRPILLEENPALNFMC